VLTVTSSPATARLLDRLGEYVPADGVVAVQGGAEGEALRPLDFAPRPNGPARRLFSEAVIAQEWRRLINRRGRDGGWTVKFVSASPAATLEWRGYATVRAVALLRAEDHSPPAAV
jgi:hypothetical protein